VVSSEILIEAIRLAGMGERYVGYLCGDGVPEISAAFLLDRLRHLHKEVSPDRELVLSAARKVLGCFSDSRLSLLLEKAIERVS
jgi:hypothetical protein